ncbi:MAG: hypothetical protein DRO13_05725 [Thermoprotei archaeon]|nr:MAG: hypothetical protein DRO13_05725 [Thermoprotei archaeon]
MLWPNTMRLVRMERFRKLVRKADIVYIPRFVFPVIPFAKKLGKKVVVHLHGYIPISYTATILAPYEEHRDRIVRDDVFLECIKGLKHCLGVGSLWWLPKLAKEWILQADKVVCVSRRQAEIIIDQVPKLRDKIEVVYNSLPLELISNKPRKEVDDVPTFLYVGGDSYIKGFHILLQAMKHLGRQGVKARFIFAGVYSQRNLLALKQLGEKHRSLEINVVERVEHSELLKLHQKAWALIFPSIVEEPLPYAVVEASVLGTIPIAAKVGGVVELLGNSITSEYMFTPSRYVELAEKLIDLYSLNVDEVRTLSLKLRSHVLLKLDRRKIEEKIALIFTDYAL